MGKPNPQNLGPAWKQGQSGNPKGRPPHKQLQEKFKEFLDGIGEGKDSKGKAVKMQRLEALMKRIFSDAMKGNTTAQKEVLDRTFGKATQVIAGDPENPLIGDHLSSLTNEQVKALADAEIKEKGGDAKQQQET